MNSNYGKYREETLELASRWTRLRKTPVQTWLSYIADILGVVGFIGTVLTGVFAAEGLVPLLGLIFMAGIAATALVAALLLHLRSQRHTRVALAMAGLHHAVHILRNEMATVRQWTNQEIKTCLAEVLGAFATVFSIIVNAPCRTCIKVIDLIPSGGRKPEDLTEQELLAHSYARTFCRDFVTASQIGHGDLSPTEAPVRNNTAFRFLFEHVETRYFLGNNLPQMMEKGRYLNTSVHKYSTAGDSGWPLPYKAAMVWPIRVVTERALSAHGVFTGTQDIVGYLAVDTAVTNAFQGDTDFHVGALLADVLYIFLNHAVPERRSDDGIGDTQTGRTTEA